jgi:aryl sulfotransferase
MQVLQNHSIDSTRWDSFRFRDGDIIAGTWAKAGTTWVQQILGQLIFGGAEDIPVYDISLWVEHRSRAKAELERLLELQQHRRFMKTHLPADAVPISSKARYIYLARDGRDVLWSWFNHHSKMTPFAYLILNRTPGRVGPPLEPPDPDIRKYFHDWLDRDGFPLWPFWSHVRSWWDIRDRPNVLLLHFNDLKNDLPGSMRRIASFIGVHVEEQQWPTLVSHCTFDYMKENASRLSSVLESSFAGGSKDFVNKGTNGRWRDVLTADDIGKYERLALENLGPECARWLASGAR